MAALLLCALSLLGAARVNGIAGGWHGADALAEKGGEGDHTSILHTCVLLPDAAVPGAQGWHKDKRATTQPGHFSHGAGLPAGAFALRSEKEGTRIGLQAQARQRDFTPVQLLMLYPHHGFW